MRQPLDGREALACPLLEAAPPLLHVVCLARLVILAADDERVVNVVEILQPHVVIRVGVVPVERARDRAARNAERADVGAIWGLLCVSLHVV
jgi:hypothetical protein